MADWFFKAVFWIPAFICTWMALAPSPPEISVFKVTDVVLHAFAFTYLSFAMRLAYERRSLLQVFLVLFGYGILIEAVQSLVPERTAEIKDLMVDVVGIVLGLLLARFGAGSVRRLVAKLFNKRNVASS